MMSSRIKIHLQSMKTSLQNSKVDMHVQIEPEKTRKSRGSSGRDKQLALQQEVEKLKKRLRHEKNIHKVLEQALTQPLGALPHLPPYLPPVTLELLEEVAVLEEELLRLEEQVVECRQILYDEAIHISIFKRNLENSTDLQEMFPTRDHKRTMPMLSLPKTEKITPTPITQKSPLRPDFVKWRVNETYANYTMNKQQSPNLKTQMVKISLERSSFDYIPTEKCLDPQKPQFEARGVEVGDFCKTTISIQEKYISGDDGPNKISESILKCLMFVFARMSSTSALRMMEMLPSLSSSENRWALDFKDPYDILYEFENTDIGPYKYLYEVEATTIKKRGATISVYLSQRLKLLLGKLASVNLTSLTHQQKLAFWINIYNSCMMNAFLEHGIPETPDRIVELMQEAKINVGGYLLNAFSIEHFILRLPYRAKYKGANNDELNARSVFGLELSEPLVTFALSCGSWSSPAVRVYTGSEVEKELKVAKRDYLQAAVGISPTKKLLVIPKLLDWYMHDFAKDTESFVDWVCLQLPSDVRKAAMKCLEREPGKPLSHIVQISPYEFRFRYLLYK